MRKALGRGLEALLPGAGTGAPVPATESPAAPVEVAVADISANPDQPRKHFDVEALAALAESIRHHGVLQPIVVRRAAQGYEVIAGERRLRAAQQAGIPHVPIVVREAEPQERLELALIENIQREDLTPLEEAEAYRHLIDEYGLTQEDLARRVGKSRPAVANALRLLSLPEPVKAQLEAGDLTAGHARAVLSVTGAGAQVAFAHEIVSRGIPKSEAERLAQVRRGDAPKKGGRPRTAQVAADPHWRALSEDLTRTLGTRVRMTPKGRGGTIEIEFYSDLELDRLLDVLRAGSRV
ncbi:MAG: ParB/RepB/Spo0J family partition protein [bacterium]|nr:ParB/RepB/Spo0J family partition protein [bacterium]